MKWSLPSERELSATEKLLQSIRGRAPASAGNGEKESHTTFSPQETKRHRRSRPWRLGERKTVAVHFGNKQLRLVKVARFSDRKWQVLEWKSVHYRSAESPKSPAFIDFLATRVQEFAGSLKGVDLWTNVAPTHLDVRILRIPKVPHKQVYDAVYWTLKKESAFDADESLLDFEVRGEVSDKGIPKLAVFAYTMPRQEVGSVRELFERSGLRLTGISADPFALQNLFRTTCIQVSDRVFASLYIGNDYSRIDIFKGDGLVFTRGIKAGVNSMRDAVRDAVSEQSRSSAVFSMDELSVPSILEDQNDMERERTNALLLNILTDSLDAIDPGSGVFMTKEDALQMIAPPLERIIRQVERTFKHFTTTAEDELISRIYVHSSVALGDSVISMIGDHLGIPSQQIDPFSTGVSAVADVPLPPPPSERGGFNSALGLALSDNSHTPNFLFSHENREEEAKLARINLTIFTAFLALVVLCLSVFLYQGRLSSQKREEISQLNVLLQSAPLVNQALVAQLATKVHQQQELMKERARNLTSIAVLSELSQFAPSNVRLLEVSLDLKGAGSKGNERTLSLDGIVQGDRRTVEASLARFVMKLSASPILKNPQVQSSRFEVFEAEGEVLRFVLKFEVI